MLEKNPLRQAWQEGRTVYGAISGFASLDIVEMLGLGGCDFVIIDSEHGALGIETMQALVVAARASGTIPLIRVARPDSTMILQALDIGAFGVHISTVNTKQEAQVCVQSARYFPSGKRGLHASIRAAQYGSSTPAEYMDWANQEPLVMVAIESVEGVKNLDEILSVPGIDVLFIGPADLSHSLGIPFQFENPLFLNSMNDIITRARKAGLIVGTNVGSREQAALWVGKGVRLISFGVNGVIYRSLRAMVQSLQSANA
jgi:4-hydroxy-2-oxoheptanedioate aldolase